MVPHYTAVHFSQPRCVVDIACFTRSHPTLIVFLCAVVPHSTTVHFSRPRCVVDIVCITPSYPTVIVFFVYSGPSLYRCSLFTASPCRRYCLCHPTLIVFLCAVVPHYTAVHFSQPRCVIDIVCVTRSYPTMIVFFVYSGPSLYHGSLLRPRCVVDIVCITPSYPTVIVFFVYSGPSLYRCSLFTASPCRRYCLCHPTLIVFLCAVVPHYTAVHFSQPRCVIDIVCVTRSYPTMIVFFVYSGPSLYHGSLFTASLCRRYCLYHSPLPHCDCLFCVQWSLTIPLFTFHSLAVS